MIIITSNICLKPLFVLLKPRDQCNLTCTPRRLAYCFEDSTENDLHKTEEWKLFKHFLGLAAFVVLFEFSSTYREHSFVYLQMNKFITRSVLFRVVTNCVFRHESENVVVTLFLENIKKKISGNKIIRIRKVFICSSINSIPNLCCLSSA